MQPNRTLSTLPRCIIALVLTLVPAAAWFFINAGSTPRIRSFFDHAAGPLWYVASIALASAIVAVIALAIRRRDGTALAGIWAVAALAAAVNAAVAIAIAIPRSVPVPEANTVSDFTRFTRIYYRRGGVNSLGLAEAIERKSWRFDEYGLRPADRRGPGTPTIILWEEYGLPFRCVIAPLGLDFENHGRNVLRRFRLRPIAFTANTLVVTFALLGCLLPRWMVQRHRRQEGRCTACGHRLAGLPRCPECGAESQPGTGASL